LTLTLTKGGDGRDWAVVVVVVVADADVSTPVELFLVPAANTRRAVCFIAKTVA
jgi:hypothetical protein